MCETCGCSDDAKVTLTDVQTGTVLALATARDHHAHTHAHVHDHVHVHAHAHAHQHSHTHAQDGHHHHEHEHFPNGGLLPSADAHRPTRTIQLEHELLAKNRLLAERNRGWLAGRGVLALNLISAPGAGKTTLLERTIRDLGPEVAISVIEGDQATLHDAQRIQATGCKVVQINTGAGCHLEADMTARGLAHLDPPPGSVVMIENVGNLVCPALFDLGERAKVVVMSVTDGDDKPVKYPHAFRESEIMVLNKIDLLPHVRFDVDRCLDFARQVNPGMRAFQVSATRGDGLDQWYDWLRGQPSS